MCKGCTVLNNDALAGHATCSHQRWGIHMYMAYIAWLWNKGEDIQLGVLVTQESLDAHRMTSTGCSQLCHGCSASNEFASRDAACSENCCDTLGELLDKVAKHWQRADDTLPVFRIVRLSSLKAPDEEAPKQPK